MFSGMEYKSSRSWSILLPYMIIRALTIYSSGIVVCDPNQKQIFVHILIVPGPSVLMKPKRRWHIL